MDKNLKSRSRLLSCSASMCARTLSRSVMVAFRQLPDRAGAHPGPCLCDKTSPSGRTSRSVDRYDVFLTQARFERTPTYNALSQCLATLSALTTTWVRRSAGTSVVDLQHVAANFRLGLV